MKLCLDFHRSNSYMKQEASCFSDCFSTSRQRRISEAQENLQQMKVLEGLAKSKKHRHLLKHPVPSTFIQLKWRQIRHVYWAEIIFSFLFALVTTFFVLAMYGGSSVEPIARRTNYTTCSSNQTSSHLPGVFSGDPVLLGLWIPFVACVLVHGLKILLHLWVAWTHTSTATIKDRVILFFLRHIWAIKTLLEIVLLCSSFVLGIVAAIPTQNVCHISRNVAALCLVSSIILTSNMLARAHRRNVHLTMFFHVAGTFIKMFLIFAPYILAFGLFFYISLHNDVPKQEEDKTRSGEVADTCFTIKEEIFQKLNEINDEQGTFFDRFGFSFLKAVTMFVGELEFSDIPFNGLFNVWGFLVFVFLIVIVLMNLLTGLAVSCPPSQIKFPSTYLIISKLHYLNYHFLFYCLGGGN